MEEYFYNDQDAFKLISKLVNVDQLKSCMFESKFIQRLDTFVKKEFLDFTKKVSLENNIGLFNELVDELNKFCEFAAFDNIFNKNIIGVGGSFNSGKSSFINAMLEEKILPAQLIPTTYVPTYIFNGEEKNINSINSFNSISSLTIEEMQNISYRFSEEYKVPLDKILRTLLIQLPDVKYSNLAFLDTPGYCKETYKYNYNEYNSIQNRLKSCNYIIWLVDAESGTIKEDDIYFLKNFNKKAPILILLSKADKKDIDDIDKIEKEVRKRLALNGINILDIIPFSVKKPAQYPISNIKDYLNKWNGNKVETLFQQNFKCVFEEFAKYIERKITDEKKKLYNLNSIIIFNNENNTDSNNFIEDSVKEAKFNIGKIKADEVELKELQEKFFSLLKEVSEELGLNITYNSDKKNKKNIVDTLNVVKKYKKRKGLKDKYYSNIIKINLDNVNHEHFHKSVGKFCSENAEVYKEKIYSKLKYAKVKDEVDYVDLINNKFKAAANIEHNRLLRKEKIYFNLIKEKMGKQYVKKDSSWIKVDEVNM